jgi:type IV pilus secretin PilQ/predicted competence protein
MRIISRPWAIAAVFAASLLQTSGAVAAESAPVVRVDAVVTKGTVCLEAQANGPFEYTTYRPNDTLFVVDLTGVSSADEAAKVVGAGSVRSYRLVSFREGTKPAVRLEVLLNSGVVPQVQRPNPTALNLIVDNEGHTASSSSVASVAEMTAHAPETTATEAGIASISDVQLGESGDRVEVNVEGTSPLAYHVLRLQHPDRLVLDFTGTRLKASGTHIASHLDPIREIRMSQFSTEVTRVVIDLREKAPYNVLADGNDVVVDFSRTGNLKPALESGACLVKTQAALPTGSGKAEEIAATSVPVGVPLSLPANLTQPTSSLASPLPNSGTHAGNGSPAPGASANPAAVQGTEPTGAVKYSGEPISVNLKDVDLRDFFRLIHEISGLNVVVDPAVKGSLTIVLDDVPWDQALDIVLRNNDLDKQLDGNVLRIATKETMKKEAEEARDLAKAQAEAADVITTTRVLSYAKSDDMVNTLKKFLSPRGDVLSDSRSNTVIIRDIPSVIPVMDNLIRQLDRKTQQVEIEARVVAASRTFARDVGSQLAFEAASNSRNNVVGGNDAVGPSPITRTPAPPLVDTSSTTSSSGGGAMPLVTNLGAAVPTSGISYLYTAANYAVDYLISAAESKGVGKLLSKPKLITQNNQQALVKQGTKIPVQTIVNNTISVQFIDVVLELQVTPQITADGNVFLDVTVTNDQIDQSIPRIEGIPAIDTQQAQTRVLINDGGTVVIGGVIVSNQQTNIQDVPIIGSLPVIGNLFKRSTVSSQSQELLFFLTPRILPS